MLSHVFTKLDCWRHLPAYQLERRVDVFFGLFLPEIIAGLCDREPRLDALGDDVTVVPEFPLHKGLLGISENGKDNSKNSKDNRSLNVDFAVFCSEPNRKRIFLVELKTDLKSIREPQLENMAKAKGKPRQLLCGVLQAAKASAEPRKYAQLIWQLSQLGCIEIPRAEYERMDLNQRSPGLARNISNCGIGKDWCDAEIRLVLMCPRRCRKHSKRPYSKYLCMYFSEIAAIVEKSQQPSASDFAGYLCRWGKQDAGYRPFGK